MAESIQILYDSVQEMLLDIKIYGRIISAMPRDYEKLKDVLFNEFMVSHPLPKLEDKQHELTDIVSDDFEIGDAELELADNEGLVDLTKDGVFFEIPEALNEVPENVRKRFTYEQQVTDALKEKYLSFGLEVFSGDKGNFGTVKVIGELDDDTIDLLGTKGYVDDATPVFVEEDDAETFVTTTDLDFDSEFKNRLLNTVGVQDSSDTLDFDYELESRLIMPVAIEDEIDFDYDFENVLKYNFNTEEESYESDEEDYETEYEEDVYEDEYEEESSRYEEESYEAEYSGYEDAIALEFDSAFEQSLLEVFRPAEVQDKNVSVEEEVSIGVRNKDVPTEENTIIAKSPLGGTSTEVVNRDVEQSSNSPPKLESAVEALEDEPKDLRQFLRKHPRCDIDFVLQYFSKKEVEKALMMGKIIRRGNKLHI